MPARAAPTQRENGVDRPNGAAVHGGTVGVYGTAGGLDLFCTCVFLCLLLYYTSIARGFSGVKNLQQRLLLPCTQIYIHIYIYIFIRFCVFEVFVYVYLPCVYILLSWTCFRVFVTVIHQYRSSHIPFFFHSLSFSIIVCHFLS